MRATTRYPSLKRALLLLASALLVLSLLPEAMAAQSRVRVRGYFRRDGTYVQPHYRTAPDGNPYNNYSFPGNFNPNTGRITAGDPAKYLERYYRERSSVGRVLSTPRGDQWAPGDMSALPELPDYIAVEEFQRSKSYCQWLYSDPRQASSCEIAQYRTLAALALPDYSAAPQNDLQRSSSYCEWLFGDNRAGFYNCFNQQIYGLGKTVDFSGVTQDESARAAAYCEWLYGDNRASYNTCASAQARALRRPEAPTSGLPPGEWSRAESYCEWLYGDNRASAQSCRSSQAATIRRLWPVNAKAIPSAEWTRAVAYCEWLYGDNRASAIQCMSSQATALRAASESGAMTRTFPADVRQYCEWLYGDNRASYWQCLRGR